MYREEEKENGRRAGGRHFILILVRPVCQGSGSYLSQRKYMSMVKGYMLFRTFP
jgi:hypothetical protein